MSLLVKDSMVLIHLAKLSLLEASCDHFGEVVIPELVFNETVTVGKKKAFSDAYLIEEMVHQKKIVVKKVTNKELIARANQFNIFGGEAEAIALCWQQKSTLLATDDDNVRSKRDLLGVSLIGTPVILLHLAKNKKVTREKALDAITRLRRIGWFNSEVLDKVMREVDS